jgi:heat shock protein HslJ
MRTRLVVLGLLLTAVLAACGGDDDSPSAGSASSAAATEAAPPSLDGTSWSLTEVAGAAAKPGGFLGFTGGNVAGSTGCNGFGGTYTQSGASLTIALGPITQMACAGLEEQEAAVVAALPKVASLAQSGGTLTLLDAGGTALLAYTAQEAAGLVGPAWDVTGLNNGQEAVTSVITGSTVTVTFAADGTVSGSAGCNTYSATYTLSGADLKVTPPAATRMLCDQPAGVMEQETAFLKALERSVIVEPASNGVTLRGANGEIQVTLGEPG